MMQTEEELAQAQAQFEQRLAMDKDIMAQLANMSPADQATFKRQMFQDYIGQGDILGEQAATADALRNKAGPEGRSHGNVYVAANPLEHIASAYGKIKGGNDYDKAMEGMQGLSDDRTAGVGQLAQMQMQATMAKQGGGTVNNANQQSIQSQLLRQQQAKQNMPLAT